jgi:hypothetical protein
MFDIDMCVFSGCRQKKGWRKNTCKVHTCDVIMCKTIIANSNTFKCQYHNRCIVKKCNKRSGYINVCQSHVCTYSGCSVRIEPEKTLCTFHIIEVAK